jgi:diadenosine tetraphosphate (Ap4A) HIT family hydrolase
MKNDKSGNCKLCGIISNPFLSGELRPCDTPFHISQSFLTIPALGPLCLGHAMIISRQHYASLLSMSSYLRKEFETVCTELSSVWPDQLITYAEHGSSITDGVGPCIAHTHINVIPQVPDDLLSLELYGHKLIASGALETLPKMADSYFLIGKKGKWFLYDTAKAPSQYIRQLLFNHYSLPHWDWRLLPNENLAKETLSKWNNIFEFS